MTAAAISVEDKIREFFEENFEMLRLEGGHSLSPQAKEIALQQVLLYWRKLNDVANKVTDTEVRLNLPGRLTPAGRKFGIDGVVDIVRENDQTVMYDIKTHNAEAIRANLSVYEKQLNIYAYIWQTLREQELDATAVISTEIPRPLRQAISAGIEDRVEKELAKWNPLVDVPFEPEHVEDTIREFGAVVDAIEDGEFGPLPVEMLTEKLPGSNRIFVRDVCDNCDGRYSCDTYRQYAATSSGAKDRRFILYFDDNDREEWIVSALDDASAASDLDDQA